jgi:hypothetical protein
LPNITEKTSFANIVAACAVIGGIIYAIWRNDVTLLENLAFAGAGYLFGVTEVKVKKE